MIVKEEGEKKQCFTASAWHQCWCNSPIFSVATDLQGPAAIYSRSTVFSLTRGWSLTVCDFPYGIQWSIKQNEWLSAGTPWLITEAAKMDLTFPIRWVIPEKNMHWSRGKTVHRDKIISLCFCFFCFVVVVRDANRLNGEPRFLLLQTLTLKTSKALLSIFHTLATRRH